MISISFLLGGDGTVNELINGVMKYDLNLPIGIIPGGTFNDFTKTLNLNPDFKKLVNNCCLHMLSHMMMKVNDNYVLNFVGLGLMVQNAENVQEGRKDIFGKLSYVGSTVKHS